MPLCMVSGATTTVRPNVRATSMAAAMPREPTPSSLVTSINRSFIFFMLVCALPVPLPSVPFPNAALTAATVFENSARSKLLRLGRATFGDKYTDKKEMHEPPTVDSIEFLVVRFHFPFYSLSLPPRKGVYQPLSLGIRVAVEAEPVCRRGFGMAESSEKNRDDLQAKLIRCSGNVEYETKTLLSTMNKDAIINS